MSPFAVVSPFTSVFAGSAFSGFITFVLIIAGMILLYRKVVPKKLDGTFSNKYLQILHDYFNFKKLYIESVLKFIFTLATVAFIAGGIGGIINAFVSSFTYIVRSVNYNYFSFAGLCGIFFGGIITSVLTAIIGPIVVRLVYELVMMFILLVKNVMEINNKTKAPEEKKDETEE